MSLSGICGHQDIIWAASMKSNHILQFNIASKKCKIIDIPSGWIRESRSTYLECIYDKEKVVLIPAYNNPILVYDINTCKFEKIEHERLNGQSIAPIRCAYTFRNDLILVFEENGEHYSLCSNNELKPYLIDRDLSQYKKIYNEEKIKLSNDQIKEKSYFNLNDFLNVIRK